MAISVVSGSLSMYGGVPPKEINATVLALGGEREQEAARALGYSPMPVQTSDGPRTVAGLSPLYEPQFMSFGDAQRAKRDIDLVLSLRARSLGKR